MKTQVQQFPVKPTSTPDQELFKLLFDNSGEAILLNTPDGSIIAANPAACKIFGKSEKEICRTGRTGIIDITDQRLAPALEERQRTGKFRGELNFVRNDGTIFPAEVTSNIFKDSSGHELTVVIIRDLTEQKRSELALCKSEEWYRSLVMDITETKKIEQQLLENERRYRTIVENVNQAYYEADGRGMFTYCNPGLLILAGYTEQELLCMSSFRLVAPEHRTVVKNSYKQWKAEHRTDMTLEFLVQPKNGTKFWVEQHSHFQYDELGNFVKATNFLRDIDERKRSEQLLIQYADRLERAEEHAGLGSWEYDSHTEKRWWSKSLYHLLYVDLSGGIPDPETFIGHVHPDDQAIVRNAMLRMYQGFDIPPYEFRTNPKYGPVRILSVTVDVEKDAEGKPMKYHGTLLDITQQKKIEHQIVRLNRVYSVLSNINQAIVRIHDRETLFRDICDIAIEDGKFAMAWIGMLDDATQDVVIVASRGADDQFLQSLKINIADKTRSAGPTGRAIKTGLHAVSMDIERDDLMRPWREAILASGCKSSGAFPFRVSGKTVGALSLYSHEVNFFDAEEVKLLDELASDISFALEFIQKEEQRKKAEEFLARSEMFFHAVWDHSASGMRITDKNGTVVSVNDAYCRMVGKNKNEIEGFLISDVYAESDRSRIVTKHRENFLRKKVPEHLEKYLTLWNGKKVWFDVYNSFIEIKGQSPLLLSVFADVTKRKLTEESNKNLESRLQQSQKLQSLGTLASGIAHDFNNILGIMIAHASMLSKMSAKPDVIQKSSEAITKAGMRGAALVKQMLTFARKTDVNITIVQVNDVVNEISKLLNETFPKTIVVELHLQNKLPPISADATQIHQVLLNLCVNGRDAMHNIGTLTITTQVQPGASLHSRYPKALEDEYIELSVRDTGTGMSEETKQRIFEPFFTTKEFGKGTGLGLSLVFGIMETHSGFVEVESELGKGTVFHCYFPVRKQIENEVPQTHETRETIEGGTETILLVEDEDLLVDLVRQILEGKGYSVLIAKDGEEGLSIYEENRQKIDLIISDMGLPKFGGYELFQKIKSMDANVRLIFASGYIEPGTKEKILNEGVKQFIQKPYDLNEVLQAVRNALR
ncbi:MAG: PAS domain S-box protein [Bacteroidota bacterium]